MLHKVVNSDYVYWFHTKEKRDEAIKPLLEGEWTLQGKHDYLLNHKDCQFAICAAENELLKCHWFIEEVVDAYMRMKDEDCVELKCE